MLEALLRAIPEQSMRVQIRFENKRKSRDLIEITQAVYAEHVQAATAGNFRSRTLEEEGAAGIHSPDLQPTLLGIARSSASSMVFCLALASSEAKYVVSPLSS